MGFIGLVKRSIPLSRNFLNPTLVKEVAGDNSTPNKRIRKAQAKKKISTGDGRSLSPITSEEEDHVQNSSSAVLAKKNEN